MSNRDYLSKFIDTVTNVGKFLILDTETTGLYDAEICQIAVIDSTGKTLMNQLVKPVNGIPEDASRIHGISNNDVANAPTWLDVAPMVYQIISRRTVVIYNADYDVEMLHSSDRHVHASRVWDSSWHCAMKAYAVHNGDWNHKRRDYAWIKLATAARNSGVKIVDAHDAYGDCMMTLGVVNALIAKYTNDENPVSVAITAIEGSVTKNSNSPMWRCQTTDPYIRFNIFKHADPTKDNYRMFADAGYGGFLDSIRYGDSLHVQDAINVQLKRDGQWWEVVAVAQKAANNG